MGRGKRREIGIIEQCSVINDLDIIEEFLLENGCWVEDYTNPEKGITQAEAIIKEIEKLLEYRYMYNDLCK
jgi:hypothetical protein